MKIIAKIYNDLPEKFGIPRQSGLVKDLKGVIVFEKEYRVKEALSGLEDFSHLWIIWQFSDSIREEFSPTVRPPRLGGEVRKGVFATRSPFRPNPIGLSCVKLEEIRHTQCDGDVLVVSGIDMKNGTPIYDIKPYIPYADCVFDALEGFTKNAKEHRLNVSFDENLLKKIPEQKRSGIIGILEQDPRPGYQDDSERIYGVKYAQFDVRFKVNENSLTVVDVIKNKD